MNRNDLLTLAQRLREYNHNPHHINPTSEAFHKLIDEAASALSILATPPADAADMGGQAGEDQGEVQRLREALEHCSEVMKDPWKHGEGCISRAINRADAALSPAMKGDQQ